MKLLTWKVIGWDWIIPKKEFKWEMKRPTPPKGYIKFNSNKAHCQRGECPNCGHEKPGTSGGHGGFQDRDIQNIMRMVTRLENRIPYGDENWKCGFDLFSMDLFPEEEKYSTMLKCHPSRYGIGEFCCCKAKIWHDFYGGEWDYYYLPIGQKTMMDY